MNIIQFTSDNFFGCKSDGCESESFKSCRGMQIVYQLESKYKIYVNSIQFINLTQAVLETKNF